MTREDGLAAFLPGRAAIAGGPREYVHRGSWTKADIYVVPTVGGSVVVKDFADKPLLVRWLGRFQTARECAAYETLKGIEGIVRFLGRVDAHALLLEHLEGTPLRKFRKRAGGRELLAALRRTLDAIHARGVIHNDLRGKDNTLVRADGRIVLIDFAGALRFRSGGLPHRLLFKRLSRVDEAAYLKWKKILDPGSLTPEEERFLRRFALFRRLWVLNPKGALRQS